MTGHLTYDLFETKIPIVAGYSGLIAKISITVVISHLQSKMGSQSLIFCLTEFYRFWLVQLMYQIENQFDLSQF